MKSFGNLKIAIIDIGKDIKSQTLYKGFISAIMIAHPIT
jgi:hypothetical protein